MYDPDLFVVLYLTLVGALVLAVTAVWARIEGRRIDRESAAMVKGSKTAEVDVAPASPRNSVASRPVLGFPVLQGSGRELGVRNLVPAPSSPPTSRSPR